MLDFITNLFSTENGALAAAVAFAWKLLAGKKRDAVEARIRETARAAWRWASRVSGRSPDQLYRFARDRAREMLLGIGINPKGELAQLLDHEIELLAQEHAAQMLDELPDLGDPASIFAEAEARGRKAGEARSEHFDTTVIKP